MIGYGIDLHVIDVPIHPGIIERVKAETSEILEDGRGRPASRRPDYGKDAALIEQLFARPEEIEIDLTGDNELPEAVARLSAARQDRSHQSKRRRKARRAEILHKLAMPASARDRHWPHHRAEHQAQGCGRRRAVRPDASNSGRRP